MGTMNMVYSYAFGGLLPVSMYKSGRVLYGIADNGTTTVVIGYDADVGTFLTWTSTDGSVFYEHQQASTTANNQKYWRITYGGGVFVIVGSKGYVQHSTDGITWTPVTSINALALTPNQGQEPNGSAPHLQSSRYSASYPLTYDIPPYDVWLPDQTAGIALYFVAYGGGKFVTLGNTDRIFYSSDGSTWSTSVNASIAFSGVGGSSNESFPQFYGLVYNSTLNQFVAYGRGWDSGSSTPYDLIGSSADGATWTWKNAFNTYTGDVGGNGRVYIYDMAVNGSGNMMTNGENGAYLSLDNSTGGYGGNGWYLSYWLTREAYALAYGNGKWVCYGRTNAPTGVRWEMTDATYAAAIASAFTVSQFPFPAWNQVTMPSVTTYKPYPSWPAGSAGQGPDTLNSIYISRYSAFYAVGYFTGTAQGSSYVSYPYLMQHS